jgi:hypothetical protein
MIRSLHLVSGAPSTDQRDLEHWHQLKEFGLEKLKIYLDENIPPRAAIAISQAKDVRLARDRLVEPLAQAKKCREKLYLNVDIAEACCEMELDEIVAAELIRTLEEAVRDSYLVIRFKMLELSLHIAQLELIA